MDVIGRLREIADEYHVRSDQKLRGVARRLGLAPTAAQLKEALSTNVAKQLLAPAVPQAQGKSAAEGLGSRYQLDTIDFNYHA